MYVVMLDDEARFSKWMGGIRRVPLLRQFFPLNLSVRWLLFPSCRLCIMSCVHVDQSSIYPSLNVTWQSRNKFWAARSVISTYFIILILFLIECKSYSVFSSTQNTVGFALKGHVMYTENEVADPTHCMSYLQSSGRLWVLQLHLLSGSDLWAEQRHQGDAWWWLQTREVFCLLREGWTAIF